MPTDERTVLAEIGRVSRAVLPDPIDRGDSLRATILSTVAFTVCFAAWVVNGVLVASLRSKGILELTDSEVAWLLSTPILTGAISRVPLGLLTDRYGGRVVLTVLMLAVAVPMFWLSRAETFQDLLLASVGFGLAGGSFAVGVGFVSVWTPKKRQGTALGFFGMGNAGAALTTLVAPSLLQSLFGMDPADGWRLLPQGYAALLVVVALVFFLFTKNRKPTARRSLGQRLAPLRSIVVWRFGLYYFLVFGGFVALAQWIVPYGVSVYDLSVAEAGLLASAFSLPSGVIRAAGGWLSDRFGARTVSYWVFGSCVLLCAVLAVPRMEIKSRGQSVIAAPPGGTVTEVSPDAVVVNDKSYPLIRPPELSEAESADSGQWLPSVTTWQEPAVEVGDEVSPRAMVARGRSRIYYPANLWLFALLVVLIGVATGIGKASVYKFIPDRFPDDVGTVGGMVGLLGALGGFVLPQLFGVMLKWTGLWSSCWIVLGVLSFACLAWMHVVARRIMASEAPELAQMMERRGVHRLSAPVVVVDAEQPSRTLEELLARVPFFTGLTDEELKALAADGETRVYVADDEIFIEGDPGDALYVILRGRVRVHRDPSTGDPIEIASLGPGRFFGELALIDGKMRSASVTATEETEVFLLGREHFLHRIGHTPKMVADLLVGLSSYVRGGLARLGEENEA